MFPCVIFFLFFSMCKCKIHASAQCVRPSGSTTLAGVPTAASRVPLALEKYVYTYCVQTSLYLRFDGFFEMRGLSLLPVGACQLVDRTPITRNNKSRRAEAIVATASGRSVPPLYRYMLLACVVVRRSGAFHTPYVVLKESTSHTRRQALRNGLREQYTGAPCCPVLPSLPRFLSDCGRSSLRRATSTSSVGRRVAYNSRCVSRSSCTRYSQTTSSTPTFRRSSAS